jgi:hypothetical protein
MASRSKFQSSCRNLGDKTAIELLAHVGGEEAVLRRQMGDGKYEPAQ